MHFHLEKFSSSILTQFETECPDCFFSLPDYIIAFHCDQDELKKPAGEQSKRFQEKTLEQVSLRKEINT